MSSRRYGSQSLQRLLGHWQENPSRTPIWRQLAEALRLLILDGRLALDSRLPGERELAAVLQVSRTTVASAMAQLREEGYLESRHGSGSRVILPEHIRHAPTRTSTGTALDLSTAVLRESIARHYCERGLPTQPDEIMVVNGAVSGLALILRLLTGPGDRVVVDHPTYPLAIAAIQGASCRPVGVSLPEHGWDTAGLVATIAQTAPRMAYLMPDFHNPTGRCMDAATRQVVADIAERTRTTLVIDETMVNLWYDAPPPPPLAAFNRDAPIILLGSAGKSFWGGLRLGWIRASARTIAALVQTRDTFDLGSPVLEQLATSWLLDNAADFLPDRRRLLTSQRDLCSDLMNAHFPEWQFTQPQGGLSFWVELPDTLATLFATRAEIAGIQLGTGTRFGLDGAFDRFLRMPFTLPDDTTRAAFRVLQPIWDNLRLQASSGKIRKII